MKLKMAYNLEPEQIQKTVNDIEKSSNGLVKKVLAEETTFRQECKKLLDCNKKEFYRITEELVDALNLYDFDETISENKKDLLEYNTFHSELKGLKKQKKKWKMIAWNSVPSGIGLTTLSAFLLAPEFVILVGMCSLMGSLIGVGFGADEIGRLSMYNLKESISMNTYYILNYKSNMADQFMEDLPSLKENYLPLLKKNKKPKINKKK